MRWLAGAGLFALVGCNQIFGLSATQAFDAAPPDRPFVRLDWQVATTTADGSAPAPVTFAAISPAPKVRIAPLLAGQALGAFSDAEYTNDGTITIPRDYLDQSWRFEYTLADGVPHEVQWKPDDKRGHITVPVFGRTARTAVPAGALYTIAPTGAPASYMFPRVFTTGLWTEGAASPTGTTVTYDLAQSTSLSGDLGNPDQPSDRGFLIDYATQKSCRTATGSAEFSPKLPSATPSSPPAWDVNPSMLVGSAVDTNFLVRLSQGLGNLATQIDTTNSTVVYGLSPSVDMPGLASTGATTQLNNVLPAPVMVDLLQCPLSGTQTVVSEPTALGGFPKILHVQLIESRKTAAANSVSLASGMETVVVAGSGPTFSLAFPAPIPTNIRLKTPSSTVALDGTTDDVPVSTSSSVFTLMFDPEAGASLRGDYYDVYLHAIDGGSLKAKRIYTIPTPPTVSPPAPSDTTISVLIDGAMLPAGDYVFEIRAFKGHPQAPHGDFSVIDYPYGSALVYTRTIKVM
ncbi:MAG TPA: hypothetical protein VFP84_32230 [Kofleriaceae bacterium]|nr:hypothetical protein [Kofleriaceae bacterium]